MKVLVIGRSGQLARELNDTSPESFDVTFVGRNDIALEDKSNVREVIESTQPNWVINTAAYTAVDRAEQEVSQATTLNTTAVENTSIACEIHGAKLLHVSTDFVFCNKDNRKRNVTDIPMPCGVYSKSKRAGEEVVLRNLPNSGHIVRTSWLYSTYGSNFVKTMLTLMRSGKSLRVVGDQYGSPTYAVGLARFLWQLINEEPRQSIYHWSDDGVTTWFDFANQIAELSLEMDLLEKKPTISSISTSEYGATAPRPCYSALDCSDSTTFATPKKWQENLRIMLENYSNFS